ncbi:response regulator [Mucilaginibacter gotjawali]|uniref:CheY-like chemotaxis protein n=2 Tax=Mucilaginibacter gotjawali TaxID=1550579 RepID=A0A839SNH7_9SPHI|nr:response regulator [Mucilaginibacter gotjawali]MBB3058774.1 CheY-like chemotaxis protein [Mucilaginibacter gotjawali]BAU53847.1 Chemotaxis protein CheY [Mucilaginibacter gotjawali]
MKKFKDLECILLVDDDAPTNFIHTKMIQKSGVDVAIKAVTSAQEALDYITHTGAYEHTPDKMMQPGIIFLDINMPGLSGWDFIEEYRKLDSRFKIHVIIIMLTTSLNPADEAHAKSIAEIACFLHKPLKPETVVELSQRFFEEL